MSRPPTPSEIQYMVEHVHDDRRSAMIVSSAMGGALAIVFVALRIVARKVPGIPFQADDWWMVVSLLLYLGTPVCFAWTTKYGAGRHVILLSDPKAFAILLLICEVLYFTNIFTIKLSLLCLYRRIFPLRWFTWTLLTFGVFLSLMTIASLAATMFQCVPLHKMWNPAASGRCIDFGKFAMAMSCLNIATDVFMLVLPLPVVWGLKISKQKKWLVSASFVVGGSACIVCLVRLLFVLRVASTPDPTWDSIPSGITSTIELCVGIFAASFPTYRPLYKKVFHGDTTTYGTGSSATAPSKQRSWQRSRDQSTDAKKIIRLTTITSESQNRGSDEEVLYLGHFQGDASRDTLK